MTTETKTTRNYMKHTYEANLSKADKANLSKADKAKQRRLTRAALKSAAIQVAPPAPTSEPAPVDEPVIEVQAEPTIIEQAPEIEATKKKLGEALNRRDKKSKQKSHK